MRTVSLVGSTGSIGTQALEVVAAAPDRFRVVALGCRRSAAQLVRQARACGARIVAIGDAEAAVEVEAGVPSGVEVRSGDGALASIACEADVVLNAVVGFAGLPVTLAALGAGKRLALANKESLVAASPVVEQVRATAGAELVPVDSEHSALHQALRSGRAGEVAKLVITSSGGPFRGRGAAELAQVSVEDALAHPTWKMGPKITVDSSTLMNKGLEVIEAHALFGVDYDRIDVVVHPQSIVHSMVTFTDGATVAQLSMPDMRLPIGYALGYPERLGVAFGGIDFGVLGRLDFEAPDVEVFPCVRLAYEAGRAAGAAPTWLNAANEIAVEAFLQGRIAWRDIAGVVAGAMDEYGGAALRNVEEVLAEDARAREVASGCVRVRDTGAAGR